MKEGRHFLFVYGTSRKGMSENCLVNGTFVGDAAMRGYWLYELSILGKSYAVPSRADRPEPAPLSGEIYEVDAACLLEMDRLHDVDLGLYERVQATASLGNGKTVDVWIYEGAKIAPTRVESGDWTHRGVDCGKA